MKKSKVILPAMALLLFSTAASVTGTVAWFSATRVFNTSAAEFGINSVDGNLDATLEARVGTQVNGKKIEAQDNCRLYHGSFDTATKKAWILNQEPSADGHDYFKDKGTEADAKDTPSNWHAHEAAVSGITYFVGFSWKITFNYTFASGETSVGVFLDLAASSFEADETPIASASVVSVDEVSSVNYYAQEKTQKGFRIALLPDDETSRVFANNTVADAYTSGDDSWYHYITNGSEEAAQGNYVTASGSTCNFLQHAVGYTRRTEDITVADATAASERICTLTKSSASSASKEVICVAWYEGQDRNVISAAQMDKVTANLTFYARKIKTA